MRSERESWDGNGVAVKRGRKAKQESRAEELREKLAAWRQIPESSRPSLRKLAHQLGTTEQLLSHYLKTQDEWESHRQAARCQESGDDRGLLHWLTRAALCEQVRKIGREVESRRGARTITLRTLDGERLKVRVAAESQKDRKADIRWLHQLAARGIPGAREVLAKVNKKK